MKWIGLTGGIASGKSTVTMILREMFYEVVDADVVAHEVVEKGTPGLKSIVEKFGEEVLSPEGNLDRSRLGRLVFDNSDRLRDLENLLHPLIRERIQEIKNNLLYRQVPLAFYDVPLLFEKNMQKEFLAVVVVECSLEMQKERLRSRNQFSESEIEARLASQMPLAQKSVQADFIIHNEKGLLELREEIRRMLAFVVSFKNSNP